MEPKERNAHVITIKVKAKMIPRATFKASFMLTSSVYEKLSRYSFNALTTSSAALDGEGVKRQRND